MICHAVAIETGWLWCNLVSFHSMMGNPSSPVTASHVFSLAAGSLAGHAGPLHATSQDAGSQSEMESMVSQSTVFKRDLHVVERQLRVLADRRVRVEAELLHVTCEETFLRWQQRRPLNGIFAWKHREDATAVDDGPLQDVLSVRAFSCDLSYKKIAQRLNVHVHSVVTLFLIAFRTITRSVAPGRSAGTTNSRPCCPSSSHSGLSLLVDQTIRVVVVSCPRNVL